MNPSFLAPLLGPVKKALADATTERAQAQLVGRAGGTAVSITLRGDLTVISVQIAAAAAGGGDVAMLEDLVSAALSDALRQHRERFGATPEEQLQRVFQSSGLGSLLGR